MAKGVSYSNSGNGDLLLNNFVEISIDPVLLNNFSTEDSMGAYFNSYSSSEDFQKLKQELFVEIMSIIENCLTDRQKEVMKMTYIEGKTQNEISEALGRHQTAIHKTLQGNIDYNNQKKRYGGALKKIRKICGASAKVQNILSRMRDLYTDNRNI